MPPGHTLYHPDNLPPTRTIVDMPKGTLRDMSRPRRNTIRIATKKESSAVTRKVTKPAKAGRTLKLVSDLMEQPFKTFKPFNHCAQFKPLNGPGSIVPTVPICTKIAK